MRIGCRHRQTSKPEQGGEPTQADVALKDVFSYSLRLQQ